MLRHGTILAVGQADQMLHVLATPSSPPDIINPGPAVGAPRALTTTLDGSVILLNAAGALFRATTPRSPFALVGQPANSPQLTDITTYPDGSLLGLGPGGTVWTCGIPGGAWRARPALTNANLARIEALSDGSVLGVHTDGRLAVLPAAGNAWGPWYGPQPVTDVAGLAGGTLLGIAAGTHELVVAEGCPVGWQPMAGPLPGGPGGGVKALALQPGPGPGPGPGLVALGLDSMLYQAQLGPGPQIAGWQGTAHPSAHPMATLTAYPDGRLLGVGNDQHLYQRNFTDPDWVQVATGAQLFRAVTVLPDGTSLIGIAPNHDLLYRPAPNAAWAVTGAGQADDITSYSALPDGSILEAAGTPGHRQLRRRLDLASGTMTCQAIDSGRQVIYLPDGPGEMADPGAWLLPFTSAAYQSPTGDGRPWGDGTRMAARARTGLPPWDTGNRVTPLIGGYATLCAIRDAFEAAILDAGTQAGNGVPVGQRGYVYIADWLLNALRDLSDDNPWGGQAWAPNAQASRDQTAIGLMARLMSAGIKVRVAVWMPSTVQAKAAAGKHAQEHWSLADAIQQISVNLAAQGQDWAAADPVGVCALDLRTANSSSASIHQKMVVVRVGQVQVGFCGGVDLAFTRRDFRRAADQLTGLGDWQSGNGMPLARAGWPHQAAPLPSLYTAHFPVWDDGEPFGDELGQDVYGAPRRWHDQHLKLEGPIVASLDAQFTERWQLPAAKYLLFSRDDWTIGTDDSVIFSSKKAFSPAGPLPLPAPGSCSPVGAAVVQLWRTIPLDPRRGGKPPFGRGEFTILAGVAHAMAKAEHLITIWDQYFWSEPLARLLNARLLAQPNLKLLIVLPPHGSNKPADEMAYRHNAMETLRAGLTAAEISRVLVLNAWDAHSNFGVYVHAKVQTYDGSLLVCGSANMNRRSFTCDMELDCAVLHPPTVRWHLAGLAQMITGQPWTDFSGNWTDSYWTQIQNHHQATLIDDPFFTQAGPSPQTPNHQPISMARVPYPAALFEPSSISTPVETDTAPTVAGDPGHAGRLDEVTFLLERHSQNGAWPYRK